MDTKTWLYERLILSTNKSTYEHMGVSLEHVAGFSQQGIIFSIYKSKNYYCAHAGEEWNEGEEPLLGYYSIDVSWDELLTQIAAKYDSLRNARILATKI